MSLYLMWMSMMFSSVLEDVGARGFGECPVAATAQFGRCGPVGSAALAEPVGEIGPPTSLVGIGGGEPFLGVRGGAGVDPMSRLGIGGRVDQRSDVPAVGQHKTGLAVEELNAAVAVLPRGDVIGDPGHDVGIRVHPGQVDRYAERGDSAGVDNLVAHGEVDKVSVQLRWH